MPIARRFFLAYAASPLWPYRTKSLAVFGIFSSFVFSKPRKLRKNLHRYSCSRLNFRPPPTAADGSQNSCWSIWIDRPKYEISRPHVQEAQVFLVGVMVLLLYRKARNRLSHLQQCFPSAFFGLFRFRAWRCWPLFPLRLYPQRFVDDLRPLVAPVSP